MVSFTTLKKVSPSDFREAADGYHSVSSAVSEAKDRLNAQIEATIFPDPDNPSGDGLAGQGAKAALNRLDRMSKNYHYAQVECGLISAALNGFASELEAAKKQLTAALEDAESAKFTVNSDGSVTYPAAGDKVDGKTPEGGTVKGYTDATASGVADQAARFNPNPNCAKAQDIADRIVAAVQEATEVDQRWAPKLKKLHAQSGLTISAKDWANVHGDQQTVRKVVKEYLPKSDIPAGQSPRENAAWWDNLSKQERSEYVSLYPASIGDLNGLPSEVRDEANRTLLAEKRSQCQIQLDNYPPAPRKYRVTGYQQTSRPINSTWKMWKEEKEQLQTRMESLNSIYKRLQQTGVEGLPEAYLLGLSTEGNGKAIVAHGNPDTADHTAVYVPGTGSKLENIEDGFERSESLWKESSKLAPTDSVSVITWYGYEAPQDVATDATESHYANEGAPALNDFMNGIDVAHDAEEQGHTTVVGHSYGTTVIGSAARQGELNTEDVVFCGSPGVQVGSAEQMDVPSGHVWNQEAKMDSVPEIGQVFHGDSVFSDETGMDWIVPSDSEFGAIQMKTDTEGHSNYWNYQERDIPTESLKNQARVITGRYDEVTRE